MKKSNITYELEGDRLSIGGTLTIDTIPGLLEYVEKMLPSYSREQLLFCLDTLQDANSAGISALHYIFDKLRARGIEVRVYGESESLRHNTHYVREYSIHPDRSTYNIRLPPIAGLPC